MADFQQRVRIPASPSRVFSALLSSEHHAAFTGAPAEIDAAPGGAWRAYDGGIHGRNVEVVEGQRIVQTWRAANWPDGVWTLVRFEFEDADGGTEVVLDHIGAPEDAVQHLQSGWYDRYWKPLTAWLQG